MPRTVRMIGILLVSGFLAAAPAPSYAQHSEFENMASRVASLISDSSLRDTGDLSVLVFAFPERRGPISGFGEFFAAELSGALAQLLPDVKLVDREALQGYLVKQKVSPFALRNPVYGKNAAIALHARYLVTGSSERKGNSLSIHMDIFDSLRARKIGQVNGKLKISGDFERALSGPATDYSAIATPPSKDETNSEHSARPGRNGVGYPECAYCPEPRSPAEGPAKLTEGTVLLEVTIDADGRAKDIRVQKGLGRGFDQNAIEAVRTWRFKPANGKDGKPVPVRVFIEVTFRMLPKK